MRRRVYLFGFFLWIFAIPLPSAHAQALNEQYLRIYLKINDAEQLEKQGDFRGALDDFKDCYANLVKIHKDSPDWESALVIKRMEDCRIKIVDLQPKADAQAAAAVPPAPSVSPMDTNAPPVQPDVATNNNNGSDDVASLKQRLKMVEQELQVTKKDLQDSQVQVETYRDRLQTVTAQLQAFKNKSGVDDKVGRLLTENKALTDKLATAQKQIDDFKLNPKSKLALAQSQLKNVQDQLDASQAANTTLQQTITNLQQHLDQVQADLVAANQKLAQAGPTSQDYATIKRENEVMRGILQRELQEQARRDEAKHLAQEEFDNLKLKSTVLREQLDILGSPMTPATTDEEKALIASLKVSGPDVAPPPTTGNVFSTPAATTTDTNTPSATPPTPDNTASTTTNQAPANVTSDNSAIPPSPSIAPTTPPPDNSAPNSLTPPSSPTDTNVAANPSAPTTTAPSTSAPDTTAPTPPPTPPAPDNSAPAPPSTPTTDNTPTVSQIPPGTTTYTDTTITHQDTSKQPDPTQYSTKARLPDDMRDTAQQAADLFKNQRYDEAAAKYQSIIDKYPESLYAWSNLGVVRFQQGDLNDAMRALQQAVKLSPTDAFSYSNLGIVYYQLGQYENAIDALNSAKALDPNDAKTHNYLGCACSRKGWQEVAEKEFLKAIELDPTFGDAHFNLALVYATSKPPMLELARQEYQKALDLGIAKDDSLEKLIQSK